MKEEELAFIKGTNSGVVRDCTEAVKEGHIPGAAEEGAGGDRQGKRMGRPTKGPQGRGTCKRNQRAAVGKRKAKRWNPLTLKFRGKTWGAPFRVPLPDQPLGTHLDGPISAKPTRGKTYRIPCGTPLAALA